VSGVASAAAASPAPGGDPGMTCAVCGAPMRPDRLDATWRCPACGFFSSSLPVRINEIERIDEDAREQSLKPIRLANFAALLDTCAAYLPRRARVLDIGCAHGWFLGAAELRGYQATGIEPDQRMALEARAAGHDVLIGFFPDCVPGAEAFDAVTFNDVFEHLEHLDLTLEAVRDRLDPDGLLIINLPVSDGLIFRLARLAARVGVRGPLARLWQEGLPSPHRSYFSAETLPRLVARHGFVLRTSGSLRSLTREGLYQRIRYDRRVGAAQAALVYLAARTLIPVLRLFPSDVGYFVFARTR